MDVYLIRHTAPDAAEGLCYGRFDVPLREPCIPAFDAVAARLPRVQAVRSSPAMRCQRLGHHLAQREGIALDIDARWHELSFGQWEGRAWAQIDRRESDPWADDYWNLAPPGGESYRQLCARVTQGLAALTEQSLQGIAVVSHAGPIRAVIARCKGRKPEHYDPQALDYGSISLVTWDGQAWQLKYHNQ